jgi:hypothetical protein
MISKFVIAIPTISLALLASYVIALGGIAFGYLLSLLLLLCVTTPLLLSKGRLKFIEPITFIGYFFLLFFGARAFYILTFPSLTNSPIADSYDLVNLALGYSIIGFCALLLGYYSPFPRFVATRIPRLSRDWGQEGLSIKVILLYCIGLASLIILNFTGLTVGYWLQLYETLNNPLYGLLDLVSHLTGVAYGIALICYVSKQGPQRSSFGRSLLVMIPIQIVYAFTIGSRIGLLELILTYFIVINYYSKKGNTFSLALILGMIVIFVVMPVGIFSREIIWTSGESFISPNLVVTLFTGSVSGLFSQKDFVASVLQTAFERFHGLDSVAMIIRDRADLVNLLPGNTFMLALVGIVPRFLWQDKPNLSIGIELTRYWVGSQAVGTSIPTIIGELYLNYEMLGVVLGMMLYGVFYRVIYLYFMGTSPVSRGRLFLYIFILLPLLRIEWNFASIFSTFYSTLPLLLAVHFFLSEKGNRKRKSLYREGVRDSLKYMD